MAGVFLPVPVAAFCGGILTLFLVMGMATSNRDGLGIRMDATSLILSGIMISAILSAGLSFLKYLADEEVGVIIFWLMGSLAAITWKETLLLFTSGVLGVLVFLFHSRELNLISLGEESARTLGVSTKSVVRILLVTASLVAAITVSVCGIIGFVGLLVPHIMRQVVGPDARRLIPASVVAGGLLLLFADTLTRAVLPQEVPIGVLTALIGGPVFCVIFRRLHLKGRAS